MAGITLKETTAASVPTPATDKATLFLDSSTGEPSYKDDAGVTHSLRGAPGSMTGPVSAVDSRIAVFDGTTGGLLKDGGKAIAELRAPSIQAVTSASTVTPTFSDDMVKITALAANVTLANPSGTAIPGLGIVIRIKDNGTARTISYGTQYRGIGVTLPSTTVISKTLYLGCIWNSDDTKLDVVAVGQEA